MAVWMIALKRDEDVPMTKPNWSTTIRFATSSISAGFRHVIIGSIERPAAYIVETVNARSAVEWLAIEQVCTGIFQFNEMSKIRIIRSELERVELVDCRVEWNIDC